MMSCSRELDDLMQVINRKFRDQRKYFEQQRSELVNKLEEADKKLKERDQEIASLRGQLSASRTRQSELEKLVIDHNSLIRRMESRLNQSMQDDCSTIKGNASIDHHQSRREDKCVSTEDWNTILEKELTQRIEMFAAYLNRRSSINGDSLGRLENSILSVLSRASRVDETGHDSMTSKRINGRGQTAISAGDRFSMVRRDRPSIIDRSVNERGQASVTDQPSVIDGPIIDRSHSSRTARDQPSRRGDTSITRRDRSSIIDRPMSAAIPISSTPATSVWHASTPHCHRHQSQQDQLFSDNTLVDLQNNLDHSLLENDLLQRFSELESVAHSLFDEDFGQADGKNSKNGSVVTNT